MKLQSYEPQVRMSQPKSAAVVVNNDVNAYGNGSGADFRDLSQAVNKWTAELDKQIENDDRTAILKAVDAYNQGRYDIMYNENDGLMHAKGESANGISQAYVEKNNILRSQVLDTYKVTKKENLAGLVDIMDRAGLAGYSKVNELQHKEGEAVKDAALNNNITNVATMLQKDYSTPGAIDNAIQNAHLLISLRYGDAGKDIIEAANRKADEKILEATISQAIAQDNFQAAANILKQYGNAISTEKHSKFTDTIQQKGSQEYVLKLGRQASEMFSNEAAAMEWIRKQPGFSVVGENRPLSEVEARTAQSVFLTELHTKKRLYKEYLENSSIDFSRKLLVQFNQGMSFDAALAFAKENAGDNQELYNSYVSMVRKYYINGVSKMSNDLENFAQRELTEGRFDTMEKYIERLTLFGASPVQLAQGSLDWKDWRYGNGKYKYNAKDLLGMALPDEKLSADEKLILGRGLEMAVGKQIAAYMTEKKREPSVEEVSKMAQLALTFAPVDGAKTRGRYWGWNDFETSPGALATANIISITDAGNNMSQIKYINGNTEIVTGEQLEKILGKANEVFKKYQKED